MDPHRKPPPQLVHAILPRVGVGAGVDVGVAVGAFLVQAVMTTIVKMITARIRGLTKRVYRAKDLRLRR
jgi:hypothetical protein